jgi:hypothetical protein
MAPPTRDITQARVRLSRETLATLTEWQVHALRRGSSKPSYGELIDALVAVAVSRNLDVVGADHAGDL